MNRWHPLSDALLIQALRELQGQAHQLQQGETIQIEGAGSYHGADALAYVRGGIQDIITELQTRGVHVD